MVHLCHVTNVQSMTCGWPNALGLAQDLIYYFFKTKYVFIDRIPEQLSQRMSSAQNWGACPSTSRRSGLRTWALGQLEDSAMRLLDACPPASSLSFPICELEDPLPLHAGF